MSSNADKSVATAMALERRLLQPTVRASATALDALLDPEFQEIGASGRLWTRADTIRALTRDPQHTDTPIRDGDMEGRRLADDLVLLTYVSDESGRRARRTSLWRFDEGSGWRFLHHQGTLIKTSPGALVGGHEGA
jgi:ribonuclease HI